MSISKETESWLQGLKSEGKVSDETIAQLRTAAEGNSETDNFFKGSVLRQADFSRVMGEVQKAQTELQTAQATLAAREESVTKFQTELGQWKEGAEGNYKKALEAREKSERGYAAAVAKLRNVAVANGLPEDEVLKDLEHVENKQVESTPNGFDASKYVTKADISDVTSGNALVNALIYDLGEEHRDLFGTRLPNAKELVSNALKAGKPLKEYWEETFKVADKRKEIYEKSVEEKYAKDFADKEVSLRSQLQIPQQRPGNTPYSTHPLFSNEALVKGSHNETVNSSGGVSAAVAAFNDRKYSK